MVALVSLVDASGLSGSLLGDLTAAEAVAAFQQDVRTFGDIDVSFTETERADPEAALVVLVCPPPPRQPDGISAWAAELVRRVGRRGGEPKDYPSVILVGERERWSSGVPAEMRDDVLAVLRGLSPYRVLLVDRSARGTGTLLAALLGALLARREDWHMRLVATLGSEASALASWPRTLADGTYIPRPEAEAFVNGVAAGTHSTHLLVGSPGTGKSAMLADAAARLSALSIPVLAVKADALAPSIQTADDLRRALGLPFGAAMCIAALRFCGPVVLLVDQLDAVSLLVDVKTGRLDVLLGLIAEVSGLDGVHVAASTRPFERTYDIRLRSIDATEVALSPLPRSAVESVLDTHGLPPLPEGVDVPSPWLLRLVTDHPPARQVPLTLQSALDAWWTSVVTGGPLARQRVLERLTQEITLAESFWIDERRLTEEVEGGQEALEALERANIVTRLTSQPALVGYRHQTVYSFALARTLASGTASLSDHVIHARREGLFVRQPLLATLTYLRETDTVGYERELRILLESAERRHIRALLMQWLGSQEHPTVWERASIEALLETEDRDTLLASLAATPASLDWLAETPVFRDQVAASPERAGALLPLVAAAARAGRPSARAVLETHWASAEGYERLVEGVLSALPMWTPRDVDTLEALVRAGTEGSVLYRMRDKASQADALRVFRASLDRRFSETLIEQEAQEEAERLAAPGPVRVAWVKAVEAGRIWSVQLQARVRGETVPTAQDVRWRQYSFDVTAYSSSRSLSSLFGQPEDAWRDGDLSAWAKESPEAFLNVVWPWAARVLDRMPAHSGGVRSEYDERYALDRRDDLEPTRVIDALFEAAGVLAKTDPDAWDRFRAQLEPIEARVPQAMLATGWARSGRGSDGLAFLLGDARRLLLGDDMDEHSYTKELLSSLYETLDAGDRHRLDLALDSFQQYLRPLPGNVELRRDRLLWERQTRLRLLQAIPPQKRSPLVRRRIGEEERVFPEQTDWGVRVTGFREVGWERSPEALRHMPDDAVLALFDRLDDSTGWDAPQRHVQRGGAVEQSRAFGTMTETDPERALGLFPLLDPARHKTYAAEAVAGLSEAGLGANRLTEVVIDLDRRGFVTAPFQGRVASAMGKAAKREGLSDAATDLLLNWLVTNPEPTPLQAEKPRQTDRVPSASIVFGHGGTSTVPHGRGMIVGALLDGLLNRAVPDDAQALRILEERLPPLPRALPWRRARSEAPATETDVSVWAFILLHALPIVNREPARLAAIFDRVASVYPSVWEHGFVAHLVARAMPAWKPQATVRKWLTALSTSASAYRRQLGGELWTCAYAARRDESFPLDALLGSDLEARRGLCFGAVDLWVYPEFREDAARVLAQITGGARAPAPRPSGSSEKTPEVWDGLERLIRRNGSFEPLGAPARVVLTALADRPDISIQMARAVVSAVSRLVGPDGNLATQRLAVKLATGLIEQVRGLSDDTQERWQALSALGPLLPVALTLHRSSDNDLRDAGLELFEDAVSLQPEAAVAIQRAIDEGLGAGDSFGDRGRTGRVVREF